MADDSGLNVPNWAMQSDSNSAAPVQPDALSEWKMAAQAAQADKLARQSVTDPYAVTPSIVPPSPEQALQEQLAQQGSYPGFQAGGPQDVQNTIAKNQALVPQEQVAQVPATETVQADPSQFVAPVAETPAAPNAGSDAVGELQKAYDLQRRGIESAADAGAKKAMEEASYRETQDKDIADRQIKAEQSAKEIQDSVDSQIKELDGLKTEMATQANEKVDPQNFFNSKSTGQKILAGISVALGGIGGAYTGKGDNKALEIINRAIDQDIDAQKFNLTRRAQGIKDRAGVTQGMLSALNQKFNNTMQAEQAARYLMFEKAKNKLEQTAAKWQSPELKAKSQVLMGQLNAEAAKSLYAFKSASQEHALQTKLLDKAYGQPGKMNPREISLMPKDFQERYVPGYGPATNKNAAEDFQKYRAEVEPALDNGREVLKLGKNLKGLSQLNPVKRAEIESRLAILAGQLRLPITGPGALTADEYSRLRDTVGDPKKIMSLNQVELKKLGTVVNWLDKALKSRAEQSGLAVPSSEAYNKALGFKPSN